MAARWKHNKENFTSVSWLKGKTDFPLGEAFKLIRVSEKERTVQMSPTAALVAWRLQINRIFKELSAELPFEGPHGSVKIQVLLRIV